MKKSLSNRLAFLVDQFHRHYNKDLELSEDYKDRAESLAKEHLPSSSGFDRGTQIDVEASTDSKLVLFTEYRHMRIGTYVKRTKHKVIITNSLAYGMQVKVYGPNYNDIKPYIQDTFIEDLRRIVSRNAAFR